MYLNLSGTWNISLEADEGKQSGTINLPDILQASGYGNIITKQTPWVSKLHDPFWYEQEEYKYAQEEGVNVPFLSQPPRHFLGQAIYERSFTAPASVEEWHFHVEAARWRSQVWIDGEYRGEDCTLCGPHDINVGKLAAGTHTLKVLMDNSMIYPYRPDGHGVSDALGGTWNGMVGEIALFTEGELNRRECERREYALARPRTVEARDGRIFIDGSPIYFRATHFGGDYPLEGHPMTDKAWWRKRMEIMKEWGLNGIRFHSYCPPEAAFAAADEEGMYLLVECGMWNYFGDSPEDEEMLGVLRRETERILRYFGHHPSFVFFSPSNEPGGRWYRSLRKWVSDTRAYDESLGYGGRRIYTSQSGWAYDVPPAEIEGTDFIYFHRSGYGPYDGGTVRNPVGWRGRDYSPSLQGVRKPVICHELGQICAYPDYSITEKFTGFLQPGNYKVFRENARANGILPYEKDFVKCSGENQVRLYKEELEANFRTPELQGFELLDLHDYLGQGTALVGILDAFWESKGYGSPEEFRGFCGDTVLLARCESYVWKRTDTAVIPVEICHYGKKGICGGVIRWRLCCGTFCADASGIAERVIEQGELAAERILPGGNEKVGSIILDFGKIMERAGIAESVECILILELHAPGIFTRNHWSLYVFADPSGEEGKEEGTPDAACGEAAGILGKQIENMPLYTRIWREAKAALEVGRKVVYAPYLSDLNYECPGLSARSVNWNGQMGPTWRRTMGVVIDEKHPIFRHFPTGHSGGWQWEDILEQGRGFHMEGLEHIKPIVQPIDDWNRNLLQGLIFEAKVLNGRLLLVTANLEGDFAKRPAAYCLKRALLEYAASEDFAPEEQVRPEAIEAKLFPVLRMGMLTKKVLYGGTEEGNVDGEQARNDKTVAEKSVENEMRVINGDAIVEADPNTSVRLEKADFPISITIVLKKPVAMRGIVYMPEQRSREHEGFSKDYILEIRDGEAECWEKIRQGTFRNTIRSQSVLFDREVTGDALRLTVLSAYGCVDKYQWKGMPGGWKQVFCPKRAVVQIAGIHIICDEDVPGRDEFSSGGENKSRTKEIDP